MKQAKVLIARHNGEYHVKVEGRANFECSPPLRNFANCIDEHECKGIFIDLSGCIGMDSTFMGILALIGLKTRKFGSVTNIVNASESNQKLLNGLGLQKIFNYMTLSEIEAQQRWVDAGSSSDKKEKAETVLEAHETLMEVDNKNVQKFKNVVDFVKKDLGKDEKKD